MHSTFRVRMHRSTTARLPYLPTAPNRCWMPRRRHQRLNSFYELPALIRDEVSGPRTNSPEKPLQKVPDHHGGGLSAVGRESHDAPRVVIGGNPNPPAQRPNLRQGEGKPRGPEAECSGSGAQVYVPEVIRMSGSDHAGDLALATACPVASDESSSAQGADLRGSDQPRAARSSRIANRCTGR